MLSRRARARFNPDWAAFELPFGEDFGKWWVTGSQALSHASLYGMIGEPFVPVPEPATLLMLGSGLAVAAGARRRRRLRTTRQ